MDKGRLPGFEKGNTDRSMSNQLTDLLPSDEMNLLIAPEGMWKGSPHEGKAGQKDSIDLKCKKGELFYL